MPQVKVYGLKENIAANRRLVSLAIQTALSSVMGLAPEKRFQRFFGLDFDEFIYPGDRGLNYTVIEIMLFAGRPVETKKELLRSVVKNITDTTSIAPEDLEIIIIEVPSHNWALGNIIGDEL